MKYTIEKIINNGMNAYTHIVCETIENSHDMEVVNRLRELESPMPEVLSYCASFNIDSNRYILYSDGSYYRM